MYVKEIQVIGKVHLIVTGILIIFISLTITLCWFTFLLSFHIHPAENTTKECFMCYENNAIKSLYL